MEPKIKKLTEEDLENIAGGTSEETDVLAVTTDNPVTGVISREKLTYFS